MNHTNFPVEDSIDLVAKADDHSTFADNCIDNPLNLINDEFDLNPSTKTTCYTVDYSSQISDVNNAVADIEVSFVN